MKAKIGPSRDFNASFETHPRFQRIVMYMYIRGVIKMLKHWNKILKNRRIVFAGKYRPRYKVGSVLTHAIDIWIASSKICLIFTSPVKNGICIEFLSGVERKKVFEILEEKFETLKKKYEAYTKFPKTHSIVVFCKQNSACKN
jgi:hypothetical protein